MTELKHLYHDLDLPLDGRKEDILDRVTSALNISKSGSLEPKSEHYALSSFDRNASDMTLGKLSSIGGQWDKDLSCIPSDFGLEVIKTCLIDSPDKTFDKQSIRAYKSLHA